MKTSAKFLAQIVGASLACTVATTVATSALGASADVKPIGLVFEEVAATHGDVPQPAYERVVLTLKNVGTAAAGHTWQELCPNAPSDQLFCLFQVANTIKGINAGISLYAVDSKQYLPGKTFTWELGLPPHTLSQCEKVTVSIDKNKKLGQFGVPSPFLNDTAVLTATEIGNSNLCLYPWPGLIQAAEATDGAE